MISTLKNQLLKQCRFKSLHVNMKYLILKRYGLIFFLTILLKGTAHNTDDNMIYLMYNEKIYIQMERIVEHTTYKLLRLL